MVKVQEKTKEVKRAPESASHRKSRQLARRFNKLKVTDSKKKGIIYIGHLPKGFNETELKSFFTQFGVVSKLRVSRSPKTARPKGYAFLYFADPAVAAVAAKAMDKYMMFGRQLDVHVMEEVH
jgi:nucleolar protein 15